MMYPIKEKSRVVKGVEFPTYEREIFDCNCLKVEAGTTGYQGGDTGHGGRTYFRIMDEGCTDINVRAFCDRFGTTKGFEVELGGDAELETMKEALKFILHVLEEESKERYEN